MKITRKSNDISILEMDFSDIRTDIDTWKKKRERKKEIYNSYTEMINALESFLLVSEGLDVLKLKMQILCLKKLREKYRVSGKFEVKVKISEKPAKSAKRKALNLRSEE